MKRLVSIALLLLLVVAIPVGASTFLRMSQKDLIRDSAAVVQGRVLQVNSFWEKTGRIIVTEALVRVDEAVYGDVPSVVVVRTFGGTVDGFTVEAHGFPKFRVNEQLLLYLEPERDGASRVTGYQQGQFRIVRDKAGVAYAVPTEDGSRIVTPDGRTAAPAKAVRLDALKESIRNEARRAGRVVLEN
ncbi:MAG TPA: hypothetical protein VGG03_04910 [Thermoanaerobaculia bacterium]